MEKRLILKLNHVTGEVDWENPDNMNNFEALGLVEMFKLQVMADLVSENDK